MSTATVSRTPPKWLREGSGKKTTATAYLTLGEGEICLPLVAHDGGDGNWMALTVLMPGKDMIEGKQRADWNQAAARQRAGRKGARKAKKHEHGRPRLGPSTGEWG